MTTAALILAAFAFGFLLADGRAVRQCNAHLDQRNRDLDEFIREIARGEPVPVDAEREEPLPTEPTVH